MAKDDGGSFVMGFLLGGLVGAAIALLFAPQPGEQTVAMLREKGIELKERVSEMSPEEAKKILEEAIAEGKVAAARVKEEVARAKEVVNKLSKKDAPASEEPPAQEIPLA